VAALWPCNTVTSGSSSRQGHVATEDNRAAPADRHSQGELRSAQMCCSMCYN
jgi:hypothetical protein